MTADQGFYPLETMARVLNVSPRRVQQLAQTGIIPKAERGRYQLADCIGGYVRYLQDQIERCAPSDLDQHRLRLLDARHRKLTLDNDQREAGLIPLEEARIALEMVISTWSTCSRALTAPRLIRELCALESPAMIRARLKEATIAIRQAVSDRLEALAKRGQKARLAH